MATLLTTLLTLYTLFLIAHWLSLYIPAIQQITGFNTLKQFVEPFIHWCNHRVENLIPNNLKKFKLGHLIAIFITLILKAIIPHILQLIGFFITS